MYHIREVFVVRMIKGSLWCQLGRVSSCINSNHYLYSCWTRCGSACFRSIDVHCQRSTGVCAVIDKTSIASLKVHHSSTTSRTRSATRALNNEICSILYVVCYRLVDYGHINSISPVHITLLHTLTACFYAGSHIVLSTQYYMATVRTLTSMLSVYEVM